MGKKKVGRGLLFVVTVGLPTIMAAAYYGTLASDVYVSESRYVVRSADRQETPSIGALIKGGGVAAAGADNAGVVRDYVLSRAAVGAVQNDIDMKGGYSKTSVDFISRFPGFLESNNLETFFEHYKKYVTVVVDPVSATSTLAVRAFDPGLAYSINEQILRGAEDIVNSMNHRMRDDMIGSAQREVATAEERVLKTEEALFRFRGERGVVNPEQEAVLQVQRADRLRELMLEAQTRLEQVRVVAADSPQIPVLKRQVGMLEAAIRKAEARTTDGDQSLVANSSQYHRLSIERELAAKQLAMAMERLDRAQNEAARKQIYLERIAQPSQPDGALEPRRIRGIFATLMIALVSWGVLSVLVAGIREHKEVL